MNDTEEPDRSRFARHRGDGGQARGLCDPRACPEGIAARPLAAARDPRGRRPSAGAARPHRGLAGGARAAGPMRPSRAARSRQGARRRRADGTISKVAGVSPGCSPSTSIGSAESGVMVTRRARRIGRLRVPDVRAAVELVQVEGEVELRDVAPHQHVQQAVGRVGVGQDLHAAREVAAVGDDRVVADLVELLVVDLDAEAGVAVADEGGDRRPAERHRCPQRLAAAVDAVGGDAGQAGAGDVDEVAALGRTVAAGVLDPAEVDRAGGCGGGDRECPVGVLGDAEGAHDVAARAALDDRQLGASRASGQPVCHLGHGAVAAHRDHQRHALLGRLARELGRVPAPLGQAHVHLQPVRLSPAWRSPATGGRCARRSTPG